MRVFPVTIFEYLKTKDLKEHNVCIKFPFRAKKYATETFKMLQAGLEGRKWVEHKFLSDFTNSKAM
jgi:hypothetical protein